jgi:hypothetical protein
MMSASALSLQYEWKRAVSMIYVCMYCKLMEVKAVYIMYSMYFNYDGSVAMMRMRCDYMMYVL